MPVVTAALSTAALPSRSQRRPDLPRRVAPAAIVLDSAASAAEDDRDDVRSQRL